MSFFKKNPRSITRNTVINLMGSLLPGLLLLVTIPLYLHMIGAARYGALAIIWVLLGYFAAFDLGLGRAVANKIAQAGDFDHIPQRVTIFWTSLILSGGFGLLGALFLYPLSLFLFVHVLHIAPLLQHEAMDALPWYLLALPLATVISVLGGALEGREAFVALNAGQLFGLILYQLLPLAVAWAGFRTLPNLVAAALLGRTVSALLLFWSCRAQVPLLRGGSAHYISFDWKTGVPMLRYGSWISLSGIVSPLLTLFDRFLIGAQLGMVAVAHYTVPYSLVTKMSILPQSFNTTLFPRYAMVDETESITLMEKALRNINAIMTPLTVVSLVLLRPFLDAWVGVGFATQAAPVGMILLAGIWVNALAYAPYAWLQARGRPDLTARFHLIELLPYLAILWVFLHFWGLAGVALAWTLRVSADALLLFSSTSRFTAILYRILWPGMVIVLTTAIALFPPANLIFYRLLNILFFAGALYWSIVTTKVMWQPRFYVWKQMRQRH